MPQYPTPPADAVRSAFGRSGGADHVLIVCSDDPCVVKEVHVTMYHVRWELTRQPLAGRC